MNLSEQTAWAYTKESSPQLIDELIERVKQTGYQAELIKDDEQMREQQQTQFSQTQQTHRRSAIAGIGIGVPLMLWGLLGGSMMITSSQSQWGWGIVGLICLFLLATAGRSFSPMRGKR